MLLNVFDNVDENVRIKIFCFDFKMGVNFLIYFLGFIWEVVGFVLFLSFLKNFVELSFLLFK